MKALFCLVAVAAAFFMSAPAWAHANCGNRDLFLKHLEWNYSEQIVALGITAGGSVLEVLTSPEGTWTMLVTNPRGLTCMFASGESWEVLDAGERIDER